jgi:alpha-glucosidase
VNAEEGIVIATDATAPRRLADDPDWWRQAVVYQVYPRSFADSDGDGIGDLAGVTSRVPYLASLGIDAVWLSPFYPSALADGGYDIDDHRDVDPRLGTLDDFDEMVDSLHRAGIRFIIDIVPNHTSNRHPWFQQALEAGPGSPARERYHFRDGQGPGGTQPPTDWQSLFGGPAWEPVGDGQWYLHLFAPEQPDLNWDNQDVREDLRQTLVFWADRGVDGFRIDAAHGLVKDLSEPLPEADDLPDALPDDGSHPLWDQDGVHEVYASWRELFDQYDPPLVAVAEATVHPTRRARYATPDGLGQAFNFSLLEAPWDPTRFRTAITDELAAAHVDSSSTWVLSNHDVVRPASRYGLAGGGLDHLQVAEWVSTNGTEPPLDPDLGLRRARAAALLLLALPGAAYLYQGEELGLHEVADLPDSVLQDPTFRRTGGTVKGRDGCRVPLPWTLDGDSFGFGTNGAHLPQPDWFGPAAVEVQEATPGSTLRLYRDAIRLRNELSTTDTLDWIDLGPDVLAFRRSSTWISVTNFAPEACQLPAGRLLLTSASQPHRHIPPDTTVWLASRP